MEIDVPDTLRCSLASHGSHAAGRLYHRSFNSCVACRLRFNRSDQPQWSLISLLVIYVVADHEMFTKRKSDGYGRWGGASLRVAARSSPFTQLECHRTPGPKRMSVLITCIQLLPTCIIDPLYVCLRKKKAKHDSMFNCCSETWTIAASGPADISRSVSRRRVHHQSHHILNFAILSFSFPLARTPDYS